MPAPLRAAPRGAPVVPLVRMTCRDACAGFGGAPGPGSVGDRRELLGGDLEPAAGRLGEQVAELRVVDDGASPSRGSAPRRSASRPSRC